ncbi:unnamed protein product [Lathyrus sativus]|nr:unnamed protein product [Lathyrus sativus]
MGVCYSCNASSIFQNIIRVVHVDGSVEDFHQPISAYQIIGNQPKHFVCTSIQLLSSSYKPLKPDNSQLQPGQLYFMLPYSVLQADVSPVDLACLAKRLTAKAKNKPCDYNKAPKAIPILLRSPCRVGMEEKVMMNRGRRSPCRMQSWKPILESIAEKSLNRRSESDLQDIMFKD